MNRRMLLAGLAITPIAACAKGTVGVDSTTIDLVQAASVASKTFCGLLPTADTIAKIALALAMPAGIPIEQVAANIAHAFCDQVAPIVAARQGRRAIEPSTGRSVIDYGVVIINGKPVNISVYAQ